MYRKSYISNNYKDYISKFSCVFCKESPVDIHHESITSLFSGSVKKKNDFTALPVCHSCHIGGVHVEGTDFWKSAKINPLKLVKKLLKNYKVRLSVDNFPCEEEYLDNLKMVNDTLEMIAKHPNRSWIE